MPMAAIAVKRGDTYCHVSAGGGGMGSPLDRDPSVRARDVLDGKVGAGRRTRPYGVVLSARPAGRRRGRTAERRASLRTTVGEPTARTSDAS